MVTLDSVSDYIRAQWDDSVRCAVSLPGIVSIPIPHTVPSPHGKFKAQFYWDTYFTNLGLLRSGRWDLARSNCDALLWWIEQLGFVPNSAFESDSNRSQPPFLSMMVREVHEAKPDLSWLERTIPRLEREYRFWIERRTYPGGLAHHGHHADPNYLERFYDGLLHRRLGLGLEVSRETKIEVAAQMLAEAETGQDFTPLYDHRPQHYADVELNTLLWTCETNFAFFCAELNRPERDVQVWTARAAKRQQTIQALLWDEVAGLFRPFDVVWRRRSKVAHLGAFYPLWAGLATPSQAAQVRANLPRFEREFGVAQTEPYGGATYQWAYPNGWPPTHWIVVAGLRRYGFEADACRIAGNYCEVQRRMFASTGSLWEKFDVTTGLPAGGEYSADPMLGWTAGVFLAMREILDGAATPTSVNGVRLSRPVA